MSENRGLGKLRALLEAVTDREHYLFGPKDLGSHFSELSPEALKMLLVRATDQGLLERVCRGIYLYPHVDYPRGLTLYHAAAKLRSGTFSYISLESALSEAGVISQVIQHWLTLMSGGRSGVFDCGRFGHIEFVHTSRSFEDVAGEVRYDRRCGLWRASTALAVADMKRCGRSLDLVDRGAVDESL